MSEGLIVLIAVVASIIGICLLIRGFTDKNRSDGEAGSGGRVLGRDDDDPTTRPR